jgi:hypothetical protein
VLVPLQEGDAGTARGDTPARAPSSSPTGSWWDEPVASAASSYDEAPDGVMQWGYTDWPAGVPRRCSWRWRGALTGMINKTINLTPSFLHS